MFSNSLRQITMDDDFKIYVFDNRSTYDPFYPYNRIEWANYAIRNYTYLYFGQYDDKLVSEPSNDYPFMRLSTFYDNANFVGYALNSRNEFQSNRGSWSEASRYNVLRLVYGGNSSIGGGSPSENFCISYGPDNRVLTIHSSVINVAQFDNDITATGSKAFIIDHPVDTTPRRKLRHACCESSEIKNIYRDTVSVIGSCIINLDDHFGMTNGTMCALNKNISVSVSNNTTFDNAIGYLEEAELHIEVETDEPTTISFIVWGTRQDDNIKKGKTTDDNGDLITEFYKVRDDE